MSFESHYYPMFVSMHGRECLVVGGGSVGERKIRALLKCGASIKLIARELTAWLEEQYQNGTISWVGKEYAPHHLKGVSLVFVATSSKSTNREIAGEALSRGIWCNMATEPELGTFIVPSTFHRGPLTIAISTTGLSPAVAKRIRIRLEEDFGTEWAIYLEIMGRLRNGIQGKGLESKDNQRLFREIASLPLPEWIKDGQHERVAGSIFEICAPWFTLEELKQLLDGVWEQFSS